MNWRVWLALALIIVISASMGILDFRDEEATPEPRREATTQLLVDLQHPYSGTITVSYPSAAVSSDDFQVVVGARQDAHEFLDQYFIPYEDPARVQVDRREGATVVSFPILARDRFEFAFPQVSFTSYWVPLWETLTFEVRLPQGFELIDTTGEGLVRPLKTERREGRWVLQGQAESGGTVGVQASYGRTGAVP